MTQEVRKFTVQLHNHMTDEEVLRAFHENLESNPEKHTFTIEVDESMTQEELLSFTDRVKEEIRNNKLANSSQMGYNPLSMLEEYFFPRDKY